MTRTTVNGKDILVVEVPEDALRPNIYDGLLRWTSFKWDKSTQVENDKFLMLPIDGEWEIVLDDQNLQEGQLGNFIADETGYYPDFQHNGLIYQAPMDSYRSFLRSLNLPTDKRYIVLQNKIE